MSTTREKDKEAARAYYAAQDRSYRDDFADGLAHRDQQMIAFLRAQEAEWASNGFADISGAIQDLIDRIERGEHVNP